MYELDRNFANAMISSLNRLLRANITSGKFRTAEYDLNTGKAEVREGLSVTEIFADCADQGIIHQDDVIDFNKHTNIEYLQSFFENCHGKDFMWIKYRKKVKGKYRWMILEMYPTEAYSDENQEIYILVKDIDDSLRGEGIMIEDVFRSLSENYESIYSINLETGSIVPYRMSSFISENYGHYFRMNSQYDKILSAYIRKFVHEKDRNYISTVMKMENVKQRLLNESAFNYEFQAYVDGRTHYYRVKVAGMYEKDKLVNAVLGQSDITNEKQKTSEQMLVSKKILIVEDNPLQRDMLAGILQDEYEVLMAGDGEEALHILEEESRNIAVVLSDVQMPKCDGYTLLTTMKGMDELSSIPVIITSAFDTEEVEAKCLGLGAADFVGKPYRPDVIRNRVRSFVRLREAMSLINALEKDKLTGLYAKEFFFQRVEEILQKNTDKNYRMICTDIEKFKMINDRYGSRMGDSILSYVAGRLQDYVPGYVMGGRISGDVFAVLQECCPMDQWEEMDAEIRRTAPVANIVLKYGFCEARRDLTAQAICDRAILAVEKVKGQYGAIISQYDEAFRQNLLQQQMVLDNMETALEEHQFHVYFQPKHDLNTDKTGGAEALVRWIHPELGFMNPGVFIPLFEQNGFVTKLDEYIWEEVCKVLAKWKREGRPVVPISVNISRRDFEIPELAEKLVSLKEQYGIDNNLLHIESTESAYSDNPEHIAEVIKILHDKGFVIELDDFGTGYSSLTTLCNLDLDVMKLDMSLIQNDQPGTEKNVLEYALTLADALKLKTVAEGVETEEQRDRIKKLGCDYIQGYYYSRPLPLEQFEEYLMEEKKRNEAKESETQETEVRKTRNKKN